MGFIWNIMLSFSDEELCWDDDEDEPRNRASMSHLNGSTLGSRVRALGDWSS